MSDVKSNMIVDDQHVNLAYPIEVTPETVVTVSPSAPLLSGRYISRIESDGSLSYATDRAGKLAFHKLVEDAQMSLKSLSTDKGKIDTFITKISDATDGLKKSISYIEWALGMVFGIGRRKDVLNAQKIIQEAQSRRTDLELAARAKIVIRPIIVLFEEKMDKIQKKINELSSSDTTNNPELKRSLNDEIAQIKRDSLQKISDNAEEIGQITKGVSSSNNLYDFKYTEGWFCSRASLENYISNMSERTKKNLLEK